MTRQLMQLLFVVCITAGFLCILESLVRLAVLFWKKLAVPLGIFLARRAWPWTSRTLRSFAKHCVALAKRWKIPAIGLIDPERADELEWKAARTECPNFWLSAGIELCHRINSGCVRSRCPDRARVVHDFNEGRE